MLQLHYQLNATVIRYIQRVSLRWIEDIKIDLRFLVLHFILYKLICKIAKMIENAQQYVTVNKSGRFRRGLMDPFIVQQLGFRSKSILDLGCGSADYHQLLLANDPQIQRLVGIDNSQQMLSKVKKGGIAEYLCADAANFALNETFQSILAVFLIEHFDLEQLEKFIANCKAHLKPKGVLQIFSIDTNALLKSSAYQSSIKYNVICQGELKDGEKFKIVVGKWSNVDTHWSPLFLKNQLEKQGCKSQVRYIRQGVVRPQLYTAEEQKQIQAAHCVYCLEASTDQ